MGRKFTGIFQGKGTVMSLFLSAVPVEHPVFRKAYWHDLAWQHHAVMQFFGVLEGNARETGGVLFRVRLEGQNPNVLIQSTAQPLEAMYAEEAPLVKTLDLEEKLFKNLKEGDQVRFWGKVNAVKTVNLTKDGKEKQYRARVKDESIGKWLSERLEGLNMLSSEPPRGVYTGRKGRRLYMADVAGVGVVSDLEVLRSTVVSGIGRGKPYGAGLISILPVKG